MAGPVMLASSYSADRCATCRWWVPETMGVGRCTLAGTEYDAEAPERPLQVTCSGQLMTRLDFGCIFHEPPKPELAKGGIIPPGTITLVGE